MTDTQPKTCPSCGYSYGDTNISKCPQCGYIFTQPPTNDPGHAPGKDTSRIL